MTGIISGIQKDGRNDVSFVVLLGDADGGLVVMSLSVLSTMARRANKTFTDINDLNGSKCYVNLLSDNRIITVTGIR